MLSFRVAEVSATAGRGGDGVVRGTISQSALLGCYQSSPISSVLYALRKDAGPGFTFLDVSTEAAADTDDALQPWNSTAQMSATDALYVACDGDVSAIYVHLTTPGVWTGTGLTVQDSTDGVTANRTLEGVVDGSDGLRAAAGIYKIALPTGGAARVAFSPIPGEVSSRKWVVLKPGGFTAATTAPAIRRVWLEYASAAVTYTDLTSRANASMSSGTFAGAPANTFITSGVTTSFGLPNLALGVDVAMWQAIPSAMGTSGAWQYFASDGTWKALTSVVDGTSDFEAGPATLGASAQSRTVRWAVPSDWTAKPLAWAPSTTDVTAYWVRHVASTVTAYGNQPTLLFRARARAFGNDASFGVYHYAATTYRALAYEVDGTPPTADMRVALTNAATGATRTLTLPADTSSSSALVSGRVDFTALALAAGESLIVTHVGGGSATDVEFFLS